MSNFGTMTKPFHAGKAAHAGIMAARLAEDGFTANTDALEHPQGFLHAISPTGTEDRTSEAKAGRQWAILSQGLGIKKYPTCYCTHRAIDCMLDLVASSPIKVGDVEKITVNISDYFSTVLRNHQPDTGLAAKFSIEFCMASGIIAQRVGLRELPMALFSARHSGADAQVEIVTTTTTTPNCPAPLPTDQVTVRLTDGRTYRRRTGCPRHRPSLTAADRPATLRKVRRLPGCRRAAHPGGRAVQAALGDPIDHRARTHRYPAVTHRRSAAGSFGSALAAPFIRTAAPSPIKLRVSLDTSPSHGRTISIADFLKKLEAASQGQIAPQLFHSGQLFADHDVIRALVLGQVEMAAPGTWLVAAYVPGCRPGPASGVLRPAVDCTHRAIDGVPGDLVNAADHQETAGQHPRAVDGSRLLQLVQRRKPLNTLADLKGLKIRSPGGVAQSWRAQFFGAVPNVTSAGRMCLWPCLRVSLMRCKAPTRAVPVPGCGITVSIPALSTTRTWATTFQ